MKKRVQSVFKLFTLLAMAVNLMACVQTSAQRLKLMPTPLIYTNAVTQSLASAELSADAPYEGVLYITDRAPVAIEKRIDKLKEYSKERNPFFSAGLNSVVLNQYGKNQLSISKVETFGILKSALPFGRLTDLDELEQAKGGDERLISLINRKLKVSQQKDIFIYVHGAHDSFDSPPLIAGELWHYLGYEGVMINFLWPATTARFGYFKDTENAQVSGHNLGKLIEYLADNTKARKIHLVSHSAGGRVVVTALRELAIARDNVEGKIGNAMLIASDLNPTIFAIAISDGIAELPSRLTVYGSTKDTALGVSSFLFKELRLGQLKEDETLPAHLIELFDNSNIDVIDVSGAPKILASHGHSYFRSSPWVSSDVISVLRFGLAPSQRSLSREQGRVAWKFPMSYVEDIENLTLNEIFKN